MKKGDSRRIASTDTGGDKKKRELINKLFDEGPSRTFGMICTSEKVANGTSAGEVRKFVIQTLKELRERKKNEEK